MPDMDCEQFYAARDQRTNLALTQPAAPVLVAIGIDPEWAEATDGQLTLFWLASLIARMGQRYNALQLWLPSSIAMLPSRVPAAVDTTLGDAILTHLANADPCGHYEVVDEPRPGSLRVVIGGARRRVRQLIVGPAGWGACLSKGSTFSPRNVPEDSNPVGAALAAALGASAVYRHFNQAALSGYTPTFPTVISAWHRAEARSDEFGPSSAAPRLPAAVNLGRCLLVGAGALGGNAAVILGAVPQLRGDLHVVDPDAADLTNLNRLLPAGFSEAEAKLPKAALVQRAFGATSVRVTAHVNLYERLCDISETPLPTIDKFDIVISGVDQLVTRAFIQSGWPRLLVDAGTRGYTWRVSRHCAASLSACLGCLMGNSQRSYRDLGTPLACAVGAAGSPNSDALMDSYSFVSFMAAAFLAAEVLRGALEPSPVESPSVVTEATALDLATMRWRSPAPAQRCLCLCQQPVVQAYRAQKYVEGRP